MSDPIRDTKTMCERLVSSLGYPMAIEGDSFEPNQHANYLRTQMLVRPPEDPVIGDQYYRERITFQIFVCTEKDEGTGTAYEIASEVRALFQPKGKTFVENDSRIYVLNTPQIGGAMPAADRVVVPVLVSLVTEIFN